jgi:molybdopterin synthase catalytic subunit
MAEEEIARHADAAVARWPLSGIRVVHRVGRITPGENIVLVVTASKHRQAAFEAAEFMMDYLKANAPFWKRVEAVGGARWVEARDHDDAAAARCTTAFCPHAPRRRPDVPMLSRNLPGFRPASF